MSKNKLSQIVYLQMLAAILYNLLICPMLLSAFCKLLFVSFELTDAFACTYYTTFTHNNTLHFARK